MGKQRNLFASTRPFSPTALSPLSWRRHLTRNLTTGFLVVFGLAGAAALAAPGAGSPTSSALPPQSSLPAAPSHVDTHVSSTQSSLNVEVNGQSVTVPENGSTQQTIKSPDGSQTNVTISHNQSSSGNSNSTYTSITSVTTNQGEEAQP